MLAVHQRAAVDQDELEMLAGLDGERDLLPEERVVRAEQVLSGRDFGGDRLAEQERDFGPPSSRTMTCRCPMSCG